MVHRLTTLSETKLGLVADQLAKSAEKLFVTVCFMAVHFFVCVIIISCILGANHVEPSGKSFQ